MAVRYHLSPFPWFDFFAFISGQVIFCSVSERISALKKSFCKSFMSPLVLNVLVNLLASLVFLSILKSLPSRLHYFCFPLFHTSSKRNNCCQKGSEYKDIFLQWIFWWLFFSKAIFFFPSSFLPSRLHNFCSFSFLYLSVEIVALTKYIRIK